MPPLHAAKAFNASYASKISYTPVAVFIGGTAGIGEATVRALTNYLNGNVHIILVGRTREPGEKILSSLPRPLPPSTGSDAQVRVIREFIYCDASLMSSVHTTCMEITELIWSNYLMFSANHSNIFRYWWTEEGMDRQLAVRYYHRFKATFELLPLLRNARDAGELTILGAGVIWWFDENDFGYKETKGVGSMLKGVNTNMVAAIYNDLMIESFAERNPGISFTHTFTGMVSTKSLIQTLTRPFAVHWFLKPFELLFKFILYMLFVRPEDSGEYHLYALFDADEHRYSAGSKKDQIQNQGKDEDKGLEHKEKKRFYSRSVHGNIMGYRYHRKDQEGLKRKLWDHTMKETKCVE
ncbi:hypothetical protein K435DRAFT_747630 [Dendrothele bispora CBS 962.96]|uniref:NAD(P)-binding protein n=1 Tax=Dendrothele bispora (strain CBS 962.96) TaxID=1314807 RepID=A0A4S8ML92_DENBC|nr:hypothetical protein K435DRAFT_747630 [Dendrothele bispora CBS 962.96]